MAYKCIKEHTGVREYIYGRNMDGLGLIRQLICVWKEMAFLSTFKVALCVCVYSYLTSGGARAQVTCPSDPRGV